MKEECKALEGMNDRGWPRGNKGVGKRQEGKGGGTVKKKYHIFRSITG